MNAATEAMRLLSYLFFFFVSFVFSGCSTMRPAAFEGATPALEPMQFFLGHTQSTGVLESRGGKPTKRITTETNGIIKGNVLQIEQDLRTENGKPNHRSWQISQVDAHHFSATANDIAGTAHGQVYGNTASWSFHLKLAGNNPIKRVRMSQTMYLQPGGKALIIRTIIRKFGIIVVQITEEFIKD